MKITVKYLIAVAIVSVTFAASEEEIGNLQIKEPDDCYVAKIISFDYDHLMTCPGFIMEMSTRNMTKEPSDPNPRPNLQLRKELRSIVKCSKNISPYEYLRQTNSKRNSLMLKKCPPPVHGSFGEGWPNLEIFKFENYEDIEPLTRQHFSGLHHIETLILFINSTHHLPDDIFIDLANVTEIHMAVRNANKNIFKNLNKLERLHLTVDSRESLNNFDMNEMQDLPALKTLELTANSFTRLTKRFFEGCASVETLILKHNTIDAIDGNAFEPLTNLKHVFMIWNDLASLPEGLLSSNIKLETFYLTSTFGGVGITSIASGFFSNLPLLREITIQGRLTSIPANLIRGSNNLELLNLQFNRLYSIPRDLLNNHSKLKRIELYGNRFEDTKSADLFDNKSPQTEIRFCFESDE